MNVGADDVVWNIFRTMRISVGMEIFMQVYIFLLLIFFYYVLFWMTKSDV